MEHIKETLNSDYKFRTLTADDGYIIANVLNGFDADKYIGTKTMVIPAEREVSGLVAITERQHDEYMKVIEEKMEAEMRLKREEVGDAQEWRCSAWRICRNNWQYLRARW